MFTFIVTAAGESMLANATAGTNPVLIDSVVLTGTGDDLSNINPVTDFAGAVVAYEDYVVITFDDTTLENSYTITQIALKSGSITLAASETISITKSEGKPACFRISCHFNGAGRCSFRNISINLPYASRTRDGVIRLAKFTGETHKALTVYSASDVDALIAGADGLSDRYVPWDIESDTVITGSFTADHINIVDDYDTPTVGPYTISVDRDGFVFSSKITGSNAVSSIPNYGSTTVENSSISYDSRLPTITYIYHLYSNSIETSSTETDAARKLVTSHAVRSYVETLDATLVHLSGTEIITGSKTFTDNVTISGSGKKLIASEVDSSSYTGSGVYSSYVSGNGDGGWDNSSSDSKIPTVSSIRSAIADSATSSANASKIYVTTSSTDAEYPLVFRAVPSGNLSSGDSQLYCDSDNKITYNPSNDTLKCTNFSGNLSGNATASTYASNIGTNSTDSVAKYSYNSASVRALVPVVTYSPSSHVNLGNASNKWGYIFGTYLGNKDNYFTEAHITTINGTSFTGNAATATLANSATSAGYAPKLSTGSTDYIKYTSSPTVSLECSYRLCPTSNHGQSLGYYSATAANCRKWDYIYARYLGSSSCLVDNIFATNIGTSSTHVAKVYADNIYVGSSGSTLSSYVDSALSTAASGTGVGSIFLMCINVTNTTTTAKTVNRGSLLNSNSNLTIGTLNYASPHAATTSLDSPSSAADAMSLDYSSSIGLSAGSFKLLSSIRVPGSSSRYYLILVVRVA